MGYTTRNGRWADTADVHLVGGEQSESGTGEAVELGDRGTARLTLDVEGPVFDAEDGEGGDPFSIAVELETSEDGETWRSLGSFTTATEPGSERKSFVGVDRLIRAKWVLGVGSPVVAFSVSGEAV